MKNILLVTLMLMIAKLSFGQENYNQNIPPPLYAVITASQDTIKGMTMLLAPNELKHIDIWKGDEATKRYGAAGENGVVEVEIKAGVEILDLNALKKFFKITQYKKVNLTIDGKVPPGLSVMVTKAAISYIKRTVIKKNEEITIDIVSIYPPIPKSRVGEIVVRD